MKLHRKTLMVIILLVTTTLWVQPALADPPPKIDWKEFLDQLGTDQESDVGEQMC